MRNSLFYFIAVVTLVFSACETDFQLEGEWKDIPVVYAFLSEQDTAYYVRVEKAFLEPGGDATEIAQNPDSIYYKENQIIVSLETNGQTFELQRVNGSDEGYPREEGAFADSPNYLYKLPTSAVTLSGGKAFDVIIERQGNSEAVIASSNVVNPIEFDGLPVTGFVGFGDFDRTYRLSWRPGGQFARVFDLRLVFNYKESTAASPNEFVDKQVEWVFDDAFVRDDNNASLQTYRFDNGAFYQFLASAIPVDNNVTRKFDNIYFKVSGAGKEIEEYLTIAGANTGITSSQALPIYTNVEGGLGVVTSRYTIISEEFGLDGRSRDSLYMGESTIDLNFVQ